jgi:hypothetical protein
MPNMSAIDKLIQFALAAAGQEDDIRDRELGPIHLIKYLYLADLAYAERHNGKTYTGIQWKFHHFGPWSNEVYQRIEPALQCVRAREKKIPSKYEGDFVRWSLRDDHIFRQLQDELPFGLTHTLQKYVHQFTGMTEDLLHFVYNTRPMLQAKPGDVLDFTLVAPLQEEQTPQTIGEEVIMPKKPLSVRQKKKKQQALEQLRQQFQERLEVKKKKTKVRPRSPRYDNVFYEGVHALDSLVDSDMPSGNGVVQFSEDLWTSKARFDPDVS